MDKDQKLTKEKMKDMKAGSDYVKPTIENVTVDDFNANSAKSAVVACRSLLGC
jgi:hypothetical protein